MKTKIRSIAEEVQDHYFSKRDKARAFKQFKKFLATNCWDEKLYGDGKYDRKIFDWFETTQSI